MQDQDRDSVVAICRLAALASGERSGPERAQFEKITARLGGSDGDGLSLAAATSSLATPEARQLAYEMAVSVVYADGDAAPRERAFLEELRGALQLGDDGLRAMHEDVETLARAPLAGPLPDVSPGAGLDKLIHNQALLTGALELLPQNLASLAIIPLQVRLVYRIGADFGQKLNAPQIKDLLGAMGIGAAAQVLDGMARRILGGLGRGMFGRVLGGIVGGTAGMAASAGVSFVTTYGLGHAAKQYYQQGRQLSTADLRALFERFKGEAEALLPRAQEEIHQQARHLDLKRVLASLRGGPAT
jgi:uncharacterized protein (DUF697 family)/tellurite resistance protein